MEKQAEELSILLDILVSHHKELLSLEKKKLQSIMSQDWVELSEYIKKSKDILSSINNVEKRRMEVVKSITGNGETPFANVLKKVPKKYREKIKESREELRSIVKEIKLLNKNIEDLIESSLEVVNFSLSMFSNGGSRGKSYTGNGHESNITSKDTSLVFDLKV